MRAGRDLCQMLWWGGWHGGPARVVRCDERYARLSVAGHPLERLRAVVDFELFRGRARLRNPDQLRRPPAAIEPPEPL